MAQVPCPVKPSHDLADTFQCRADLLCSGSAGRSVLVPFEAGLIP